MAGTYSKAIFQGESPQYAYALAVLSGGVAFISSQVRSPIAVWLSYAVLAALFGSIWPYRVMQWGIWLCLPIVLLIFFDVMATGSINALLSNGMILVKALPSACLGAYVGSKLSVRKIANRQANTQVNRKRQRSSQGGSPKGRVLKELAVPVASVKIASSSHHPGGPLRAIEPIAHAHALSAALIKAVQEGHPNEIKWLVADGADVNAESRDQWMPSAIAALGGDLEMVKSIFGEGAALDASTGKGWTALMIATIEGRVEAVRALLEHGAQVNAENNKGWTALRFAVSMDETQILRVLLDAGADANIADHEGKTALMQAAGENIKESLKTLLDAGADSRIKDHTEQTALMIAQKRGHTEIVKLLNEAKSLIVTDTQTSVLNDNSKVTGKTHRVIRIPRDQYYGLIDRYDVIPIGAALPRDCEETGRDGNEEECRDYAWKSNIDEPSELGWWLSFSNQPNA